MPEYCVTGGTGFIASYLVKTLLENGHHVRTTVRNPGDNGSVGFLWEFNGAKERLKIVKADLLEEGSFDEAIQGVDGVFHTASPVLVPSSCSAIRYRYDVQKLCDLNETHWSDPEYFLIWVFWQLWYAFAKSLAEKEAWRLAEEHGMDLVVVNPSFVVGPSLTPKPTSTQYLLLTITKGERGEYPNCTLGFVHIDDVVAVHILAMEDKKASGRIICSSTVAHWSQIIDMLRAKYPYYPFENRCSEQEGESNPHNMDTSKIYELGFPAFKTLEQMFDDSIKSFQDRGLL